MPDYTEGIKKEVAEIKFLIHDLRVERFINEVIHFHVTLNTDLELYGIDQAQILHGHDLQVLKEKAVGLRRAYQDYSNAVSNHSPEKTVLLVGRRYVETIYGACELILSPLWGRVDKVLTFLPADSRSAKSRTHYRNCIHWIRGVFQRIQQFHDEQTNRNSQSEFDVAAEISDFTRDVVYGYVMEHAGGRVQIELEELKPAVLRGNLPRFRRMYFNLVMNAVDAMSTQDVGLLEVGNQIDDERVVLTVRDNGRGMTREKIRALLTDKHTLDGELHSLGFVFVRQTVSEYGGDLAIESELGKGTTITVRLPVLLDKSAGYGSAPRDVSTDAQREPASPGSDIRKHYGRVLLDDYRSSEAQHRGALFAVSIQDNGETDYFTHAPYERYWDIQHEDLSPMLWEATVRGRLDEDEEKKVVLTLKAPQSIQEYFDFKSIAEEKRSPDLYAAMVRDEYIRIARKLIATGMPAETNVLLDRLQRFFPQESELYQMEPFSLRVLAERPLRSEESGAVAGR